MIGIISFTDCDEVTTTAFNDPPTYQEPYHQKEQKSSTNQDSGPSYQKNDVNYRKDDPKFQNTEAINQNDEPIYQNGQRIYAKDGSNYNNSPFYQKNEPSNQKKDLFYQKNEPSYLKDGPFYQKKLSYQKDDPKYQKDEPIPEPELLPVLLGNDTRCRISEYQCANKKCVPVNRFCDGTNDCGDSSDEPRHCTREF